MDRGQWRERARHQDGMLSIRQLNEIGVPRSVVRHKLATDRWVQHTEHVVSTTTGLLTTRQQMWLGVLHAGNESMVGGLSAAAHFGLQNWSRDEVTILVHDDWSFAPVRGVRFFRTRRPLRELRGTPPGTLPVCTVEPAVLLFAAHERNARTAQGLLAAAVQQRVTTPDELARWVERLRPLRRSRLFRRLILDLQGGAQSLAEVDVRRMCRRYGLPLPARQRPRRDREGRRRFTDCEWDLAGGRVLVLEVDGAFHTGVESWQGGLRRQRKLTTAARIVAGCTALELRDEPEAVAVDLIALGVRRLSA